MALDKTYRASICAIGTALSILLFVSGAEAANPIDSCTTISQPGEYILSRNIINSTFSSCINITSSNVVFDGSGFNIDSVRLLRGFYTHTYAVYVHNSKMTITNVTVKNLNITDWYYGIYYLNATEGKIENNYAGSNYENGILLELSSKIILTENNASSNLQGVGIELDFSNDNILTSNIASSNGIDDSNYHGIYLLSSNNNTLTNNNASSNSNGIVIENSNNNTMTNNSANWNKINGIHLQGGENNYLANNSLNNNSNNFLALEDPYSGSSIDTSNTVDGKPIFYIKNAINAIYDSSTNAGTFYCIRCNNVTIRDLNVTKNTFGINFILTNNSKIENISASSNQFGIGLFSGNNNNTIINNKASANDEGISLFYDNNNNTFTNNEVNLNRYGITLSAYGNLNNTLVNNNISSNSKGIINDFIDNSENNSIYHNNLINNTIQSYNVNDRIGFIYTGDNLWDSGYPGGGNYWSDYNGTDINNDGIGDTPYNISGGMQDRYPFMKMNGWMHQQTAKATPGFETSWVILSVVIVFFLKRIRL